MKSGGMRAFAVGLVAVLSLSACGGGGDDNDDNATDAPTAQTTDPADEGLTEPGTELELGETATIEWRATQKLEGRVEVTVTRLDQTTMKAFEAFKLSPEVKKSTPYFVHLDVKNVGTTDLSGRKLPIYLDDGSEVLIPAAGIAASYKPCPSKPLPEKFTAGKKTELCLVFLAPEGRELNVISLRPEELDAAITWTGKITRPEQPKKKGKKNRR